MSARLWLDASVVRKPKSCSTIAALARQRGVDVLVPAQVHLELCRFYRCKHGERYSPSFVSSYIEQQRIRVEPLLVDAPKAERWADRLYQQHPSDEAWQSAKLATLGGQLRGHFRDLPAQLPMTTDWWVALQVADNDRDRIAVDDNGGEWQALRQIGRALTSAEAQAWRERLDGPSA